MNSVLFVRLPTELRSLIYHFVFLTRTISITLCRRKPFCKWSGCANPHSGPHLRSTYGADIYDCNHYSLQCTFAMERVSGKLPILGLPLTCRMAYAEALPVMYHQSQLLFPDLHDWRHFCDAIIKNRQFTIGALQSLRSIRIDYSVSGRRTFNLHDEAALIASLKLIAMEAPDLKNLHINIPPQQSRRWTSKMKPLSLNSFVALGQLRELRNFRLESMHPLDQLDKISGIGDRNRKEYRQQVVALESALRHFVYLPKDSGAVSPQTVQTPPIEYFNAMHTTRYSNTSPT